MDGICTYDPQTQILYTDKFFGAHFCGEAIFDENWKQLDQDRRFYFDCLHATQTKQLESAIADGLIQSQVAVESINCEFASPEEITEAIQTCDGFIIGSPTLGGHPPTQIQTALGIILANATKTKLAGVFGSYGWSGEAIDILENKLRDAHYNFGFEPIRVRFSPSAETLEQGKQAGKAFTQTINIVRF